MGYEIPTWGMRFQTVKCNMMPLTRKHLNKIQASYTLEGTVFENVDNICNVSRPANKPRQWKSMLTHQGRFNLLYMQALLVSHTTEFVICIPIYISMAPRRHITSPSEKSRPETWPGKHMGKATPVWQLTLSHRCHQM